jgi:hydrogenase expression/formation protein HypD
LIVKRFYVVEIKNIVKYLKEYRGPQLKIMEVCGTHTSAIFKAGIRDLLPPEIKLVSGPGCPVCVTPSGYIDKCVEYASRSNHVVLSFGDMLKVPGTESSLFEAKSLGGRVEVMYSAAEALMKAEKHQDTVYVVAAVGFETTVPSYALTLKEANSRNLTNIRMVTALKSAEPAIEWILAKGADISGFICPGHVSAVTGTAGYERMSRKYGKPFVVAGFEGEDVLAAIYAIVRLLERDAKFMNLYPSVVRQAGNGKAKALIDECFVAGETAWRGFGVLAGSGFRLREEYARFDAGAWMSYNDAADDAPRGCRCSDVLMGRIDPAECPLFARECDLQTPIGACMVSAEGACGIWRRNMRREF